MALLDGMREPFYSFNIAQCSFTTLKKIMVPTLLFIVFTKFADYYYCFSITTWIINHAGWERYTVSLPQNLCQGILYVGAGLPHLTRCVWEHLKESKDLKQTDVNSWVASVFLKFSLVLLLCTGVSI